MTFDEFLDFRYGVDQDKLPDFRYLRNHINNLKFKNVYNNANDYHKLVLTQLKDSPIGNKFITAPAYLGYFKNKYWNYLILRRIGHHIITRYIDCPLCRKKHTMDKYGNHAAICASGRHRISRHDHIKFILSSVLHDAHIRHKVEPTSFTEDNNRPGDVLIYNFDDAGLAIDVGITDPVSRFKSQDITIENVCNGYFARKYYDLKMKKFDECILARGFEDSKPAPVIFETFGYIDPRSRRVLDRIIKLAAMNMNTNVGKIKTNIYTKIGISLAKSDAQAGIARYYYNYDYNYY